MDQDRLLALSQSVAHRVLHDRLKNHVGNERVRDLRPRIDPDAQPILKANLLDRKIQPQKIQLAPQRDLLSVHVIQRKSQQIAQAAEHRFGLLSLPLAHQHHNGAERIEQEVRVHLHFQGAQL